MIFFRKKKTLQKDGNYNSFPNRIMKYFSDKVSDLFVVDIGANRGGFYEELIKTFPNTNVRAVLIEPIPSCADYLRSAYQKKNVEVINVALSNKKEKAIFHINAFDETSSLLEIKTDLAELEDVDTSTKQILEVLTTTLDDIMNSKNNPIDLIKIDVQGTEHDVLNGAAQTLQRTKYIWIEVSFKELYHKSSLFSDIYDQLNHMGFVLFEIADGHRSSNNELVQANCLFKNNAL